MQTGIENIEHIVAVMMENRSLDNLLGWLYADEDNRPAHNLPSQAIPTYAGLAPEAYYNRTSGSDPQTIYASRGTTDWPPHGNPLLVPYPDPGEDFEHMTVQIYGKPNPGPHDKADMSGFLRDYASWVDPAVAGQIMQCYSPGQVYVIHELARSFAVCDGWFASVPCQTWPNRGFVHAGSSDGHINNGDYVPYTMKTIFNALQDQGISWGVYADTIYTPPLTHIQFSQHWTIEDNFHSFSTFERLCRAPQWTGTAKKLPAYSFIEPRFISEWTPWKTYHPNDYHCAHNVGFGEEFLAKVYNAVRTSPYRDKILLIITFDEHGGCYDHVPPPTGAAPPEPGPVSDDGRFHFDRFGVRVPTIVVSSYVEPGLVFHAPKGETPYDHTSILATLRDWKQLDADPAHPFLPSPRVAAAPTLQRILTRSDENKRTNWPSITAVHPRESDEELLSRPIDDLQMSIIVGEATSLAGNVHIGSAAVQELRGRLKTHQDVVTHRKQQRNIFRQSLNEGARQLWEQGLRFVVDPLVEVGAKVMDRFGVHP